MFDPKSDSLVLEVKESQTRKENVQWIILTLNSTFCLLAKPLPVFFLLNWDCFWIGKLAGFLHDADVKTFLSNMTQYL